MTVLTVFVNIAMVMLDITIIITTGVMMGEFPQEESMCVLVRVKAYFRVYLGLRWKRKISVVDSSGLR